MFRLVGSALLVKTTRIFFFFNDTATTEIYTLSLHDALPISHGDGVYRSTDAGQSWTHLGLEDTRNIAKVRDRKSTRLNSSHANISYAVFCLKKKMVLTHT